MQQQHHHKCLNEEKTDESGSSPFGRRRRIGRDRSSHPLPHSFSPPPHHRPPSPSPSFRVSDTLDRFGRVIAPRVHRESSPGPGHYERDISPPPTRITSTSSPGRGGRGRGTEASLSPSRSKSPPPRGAAAAVLSNQQEQAASNASTAAAAASGSASARRRPRGAGAGGVGKGLLATRGGPGVQLNSPTAVLHPPSYSSFGRAHSPPISTSLLTDSLHASSPSPSAIPAPGSPHSPSSKSLHPSAHVVRESWIKPPGPTYYEPSQAFHATHQKKSFHLNTNQRWM